MKLFGVVAVLAGTLLSCAGAQVREAAPGDVFRRSAEAYRSLETYVSEGSVTAELEFGERKVSVETVFAMRLAKPDRFLIVWSQKNPMMPGVEQKGAVWSYGTQPYLYLGALSAYARMSDDCIALAGATGVSGGAALTIPSLFFPPCSGAPDVFARMTNPVLEGREKVGDEECFVVSSPTATSKKETLWISARDHLIRRYRRSLEPPGGGQAAPSADEQGMTAVPMKGTTTEVHGAVAAPPLGAVDFAYAPPPGAELKASLFEPPAGREAAGGPLGRQADATLLALEGKGLSAGEAEALEEQVAGHPDDVAARTRLLGYYFGARAEGAKLPHVLWLIENAPESEVLGLPFAEMDKRIDPEGYQRGKAAWSAALEKQPQNLKLLANASRYFLLYDPELARETLERGRSLDGGNPEWSSALGQSWMLQVRSRDGDSDAGAARNALGFYEEAYRLTTGMKRELAVSAVAEAALAAGDREKAAEFAGMMLDDPGSGWNRGNNLHQGNIVLGRLALQADDVEEAKRRLLEAGRTPGSPQLASFGPNMALARDLLEKGERDTVLQYFDLCAVFWRSGGEKLQAWTAAVREGRMPEFGANLVY